jgi:hypothetical protein
MPAEALPRIGRHLGDPLARMVARLRFSWEWRLPNAALGGIIWRADPNSIRRRQYAGSPANMLRIKVGGKDYSFRYERGTGQIEIQDGSQDGPILHADDDTMPVAASVPPPRQAVTDPIVAFRNVMPTRGVVLNGIQGSWPLQRLNDRFVPPPR